MPRDHGAGALNSDQFYAQGKRGVAQRPGRPGALAATFGHNSTRSARSLMPPRASATATTPAKTPSGRFYSPTHYFISQPSPHSPTPPATHHPSSTSVRLRPRRWRPFAAMCRAAAFQLLRQGGGGARTRLKPPDHTLVPRCCLLRQPPTTFVGAFFPARGSQGV